MFLIVVYDISKNSKRNKIAKILERFGNRVQKSVFECDLSIKEIERLKLQLLDFNYEIDDSLRFYFLEESSVKRIERIGGATPNINKTFYVA